MEEKARQANITYLDLLTGLKVILRSAEETVDAVIELLDYHDVEAPELVIAGEYISGALDAICRAVERYKTILGGWVYDRW